MDFEFELRRPAPPLAAHAESVWFARGRMPFRSERMPGVQAMRSDAGTAVGATISFESRGKVRTSAITAVEPERSVTLGSVQGGVTARYVYRLEPAGKRTRAVLTADVDASGFPWALLGPLIRTAVRRADAGQLGALRAVVESGGH